MKKEDFYIGWKEDGEGPKKPILRKLLFSIFTIVPLVIFVIVYFTKPFNDHVFKFSQIGEYTGTYYDQPIPILHLDEGQSPIKGQNSALLVGFGKSGAETHLNNVEEEHGPLAGKRIKIQGTLIYGDGKVLIELTKKEASILEVYHDDHKESQSQSIGSEQLSGEIIDPKCWFGVMKPAEGKVHKSCAIRCISGGVPPVLRVNDNGINNYYILKGKTGERINKDVLSYVGEPISVHGDAAMVNGWQVLNIDVDDIRLD
jgi:hypothetical protein